MNFSDLLIAFSIAIFVATAILLRLSKNVSKHLSVARPRANWIFCVYIFLVAVFLLFSAYSGLVGERPFAWFFFLSLLGMLSLYFAASSSARMRKVAIIVVVLLVTVMSVLPSVQNGGILFGPDQLRDLGTAESIIERGNFLNASTAVSGFYSIPFFSVLSAELSQISGSTAMMVVAFLPVVFSLLLALSVYSIMMKLTNNAVISLSAVLLIVSIPRLAMVQAISSTASISLGGLLVLLCFVKGASSVRNILLIASVVAFAISALHPVGLMPILLICLGILTISRFAASARLSPREYSFIKRMFGICLLIPLAFWSSNNQVFVGVLAPLLKFLSIYTRLKTLPSIYTPQYYGTGFELFSFAWALPVAVSAAYLTLIWRGDRIGKRNSSSKPSGHIFNVVAIVGIMLIVGSFVSLYLSPDASVERYVDVPGYYLLVLSSSFVLGQFLLSPKKPTVLFAVVLLSTVIVIGARSPDWAPFENSSFGAARTTRLGFNEASTMVTFLPNNTFVFEDHDIPVAELASLEGKILPTGMSYQTTRNVLQEFKSNSTATLDTAHAGAVLIIKTDEIINQSLYSRNTNILYNSGMHILVKP